MAKICNKPPLKKDLLISLSRDDATRPWFLQAFYYSPWESYPVRRLNNVGIPESPDDNPIKNWTLVILVVFGQLVIHNHCCLDEYSLILQKLNFWFVIVHLRGCSVLDCILPRNQSWLFMPATIISQYWLCVQVNCPEPPHLK